MKYELKQYDTPLLQFYLKREELGKLSYEITWVNKEKEYLLPIGLFPQPDSLAAWLKARVIPKNREFVDRILSRSGLAANDVIGIINICKGLSLNDSYWVVDSSFDGKFADYNLYQNKFTTALSLVAYTGYGSSHQIKGFTSSPEYTTNGMLRKCWRRVGGKIVLFKGGSSGFANTGNEPYSEFYAAQIAERMGIDHVKYNLSKWKGILCSTCELFTDIDTSFVPMHRFLKEGGLEKTAEHLKTLGQDFYEAYADMLVFDALICNTDRHSGNFGLLVDNKTNEPVRFAPLFDNGLSLFNYAMQDDIENLDVYAKTRTPANTNATYEEIFEKFATGKQKDRLRKMINFKFTRHSRYNLEKKRLVAIEDFLQRRIRKFLDTSIN